MTSLINWHPWGNETFEKAAAEDKPVMLRITASWCHWCEVMDNTSDADPECAALVNDNFIPVRIDGDRQPDINARYNLGGWPTNAFLNPSGDLITGGTYLPSDQFEETLRQLSTLWKSDRSKIEQAVSVRGLDKRGRAEQQRSPISKSIVDHIVDSAVAAHDAHYGGFGTEPKFLLASTLTLLIEQGVASDNKQLIEIATDSMRKMRIAGITEGHRFGIYDHEAGGFFRYSLTRQWTIPHFEKMLEDNARMLDVYARAYQVTGNELFKETAHGILNFIDQWMYDDDNGFFYPSVNPGGEDRYYSLPSSKRSEMPHPSVDRTLFVNWNAEMISAHLKAGRILGEQPVTEAAHRALNFLRENCRSNDGGMCHYFDGEPGGGPLLTDQVYMAAALLDAFEISSEQSCLDEAIELIEYSEKHFANDGVFMDRQPETNPLGLLRFEVFPLKENTMAATVLARLFHITKNAAYRQRAIEILEHFSFDHERYGLLASSYALAISRALAE